MSGLYQSVASRTPARSARGSRNRRRTQHHSAELHGCRAAPEIGDAFEVEEAGQQRVPKIWETGEVRRPTIGMLLTSLGREARSRETA